MTLLVKPKNNDYNMIYEPIKANEKRRWLDWLRSQANILDGKTEFTEKNEIFETPEGDIATAKDLVGASWQH